MVKLKFNSNDSIFILLAILLINLICFVTLFLKPIVGMADNGDFYRIISQSGLYHLEKNDADIFFGYFNKNYGIYKYYNENGMMLLSTQFLIIKVAMVLNRVIKGGCVFDIRFLAFIYIITMDFAAYFIIKALIKDLSRNIYKFFAVLLFIFIFCDTGYIAYFNSFYGEAVNLSFFLLSTGFLMYMYKFNKVTVKNLVIFFILSLIFMGSKQQLAPIGIVYCVILFRMLKSTKKKAIINTINALSAMYLISSCIFYFAIVGPFDYINRYHSMTRGVLLNESNPELILKQFDINDQYSLLAGDTYYNAIPVIDPADDKLIKEFYSKYSFGSILKYYLKNPVAFGKMISIASENGYKIRPDVIGNYEKVARKQFGERSNFFSMYSSFKELYLPHNIGFTIVLTILYFVFAIKDYINYRKQNNLDDELVEELFIFVFLIGVSQVLVSILGAGDADMAKHLFMFDVSFDMLVYFSVIRFLKHRMKMDSKSS